MYRKILVALENSPADASLLPHISELARRLGSVLLLLHVADGWAARHLDEFQLVESEEMQADRQYLETTAAELRRQGLTVSTRLACGNPPDEILKMAIVEECDLIAMTSHGHRFLADLFYGSTISKVRHHSGIPVLVVHAAGKRRAGPKTAHPPSTGT